MTEDRTSTAIRRDRFSGGPARSFLSSMAVDERIFAADLAVDRAHVVMLDEQDILPRETVSQILEGLASIEEAGYDALPAAEDIHEAIETALIDEIGEDGGKMHTARSRNDEVATCIRYRLRADLFDLLEAVLALREALATIADDHRETIMPGYTHLQPAQPITVAHWACSYERALARDTARLLDAYDRSNRSPLGAAAFAGTTFPIDRERTAHLLGFNGIETNAMDAAASRDGLLETAAAVSILGTTLSGLAEDVILFAHRGFVTVDDAYASTSSIMPQKKNPDTLELIRATAGDAAAGFAGLSTTLKGLPRAYNRDLQQATPHVWQAIDAVTEATRVAAGAVDTATWNADTLADEAEAGFATATGVADLLAQNGLPFRQAHEVVAAAADRLETGEEDELAALQAAAATILETDLWTYVDEEAVRQALDPTGSVAARDSTGGPSPSAMATQLETIRNDLALDADAVERRRKHLTEARDRLAEEVASRV